MIMRSYVSICYIQPAGIELVPELHPHVPNWFPSKKGILLDITELVKFSFSILQAFRTINFKVDLVNIVHECVLKKNDRTYNFKSLI
jgi:hypothetical protein